MYLSYINSKEKKEQTLIEACAKLNMLHTSSSDNQDLSSPDPSFKDWTTAVDVHVYFVPATQSGSIVRTITLLISMFSTLGHTSMKLDHGYRNHA